MDLPISGFITESNNRQLGPAGPRLAAGAPVFTGRHRQSAHGAFTAPHPGGFSSGRTGALPISESTSIFMV